MNKRFVSIFIVVLMLVSIVPTEVFAASVKIGYANESESGTINGNKGDSTGREVTTKIWFDGGWTVCLRPKTAELAEKSVKACLEGCANNNIGFGTADRNSAYESYQKVGKVSKITKSNTDSVAFMTLCAIDGGCGGLNYKGNAPVNTNVRNKFVGTGDYEALTDSKYLTSEKYLKSGDILVRETESVAYEKALAVMVLTDGEESGTVLQSEETEKPEVEAKLQKNIVKTTVKIVREVKKTVFRIVESIVNIFSWKFGF